MLRYIMPPRAIAADVFACRSDAAQARYASDFFFFFFLICAAAARELRLRLQMVRQSEQSLPMPAAGRVDVVAHAIVLPHIMAPRTAIRRAQRRL